MKLVAVTTPDHLDLLEEKLAQMPIFAYDTETSGIDWVKHRVFMLNFSDGETAWVVPVRHFALERLQRFLKIALRDPGKTVVGQNIRFDMHHTMQTFDVPVDRQIEDTQVMAFLLDENRQNGLKKLMPALLNLTPADETAVQGWMKENQGPTKDLWDYSKVPDELMIPYAGTDAFATFKLYELLKPQVEQHFKELYATEMKVLRILMRMERAGIRVDVPYLEEFAAGHDTVAADRRQQMFQAVGREFNPDSPDELRTVFYDELKLPCLYTTEKGERGTHDDALRAMDHPAAAFLREYRTARNLQNYAKGLLDHRDDRGLVHASFSVTRARTGRFSCSEPNLQNVPKDPGLRTAFVSDPGWTMFFFDHAQIEMVGFAHYAKDEKMLAALKAGQDLHALAASEVYGIPLDQVTKDQRAVGKGTNFSIIYGVGKAKLANYINGYMPTGARISSEEALAFKAKYFQRFPSVPAFQQKVQQVVRAKRLPWGNYVVNQFGRVRRITDPNKAYTAVNHLIQGWAPDLMKRAMVEIEEKFHPSWRQNVHDELRIDLPEGTKETRDQVEAITHHLTNFPQVRAPVRCKVEFSRTNWAEVQPWPR